MKEINTLTMTDSETHYIQAIKELGIEYLECLKPRHALALLTSSQIVLDMITKDNAEEK